MQGKKDKCSLTGKGAVLLGKCFGPRPIKIKETSFFNVKIRPLLIEDSIEVTDMRVKTFNSYYELVSSNLPCEVQI